MDINPEFSDAKVIKTIYLIRHGQTDFNKNNIIQGSGIDSDLNETGEMQAQNFHEAYRHFSPDKIYTSKLKRTIQSVKPFINRGCAFESLEALNEINWGEMEGRQSTPESYADFTKVVTAWRDGNLAHAIGGGETPINLQERQRKGLEYILSKENERQIIIAMHGRAMRSFLCLMMEYPLNLMDDFDHSNLCLYIIQWNGEKFRIKTANDTSHLL